VEKKIRIRRLLTQKYPQEVRKTLSAVVYTIDDLGFEEQGAVVGFTSEFINHSCSKIPPDSQQGDSAMPEIGEKKGQDV
jgi:hypothetical protein